MGATLAEKLRRTRLHGEVEEAHDISYVYPVNRVEQRLVDRRCFAAHGELIVRCAAQALKLASRAPEEKGVTARTRRRLDRKSVV